MTPSLPPELQREIFENAVRLNHKDVAVKRNLSLVAHHVQLCIFYKLVLISNRESEDRFMKLIDLKPPGFFATAVRTLLLSYFSSVPRLFTVLSACAGVQWLALWIGNIPVLGLGPVGPLPLNRLSTSLACIRTIMRAPTAPTLLARVTHLDVAFATWNTTSEIDVKILKQFSRLTHVALDSKMVGPAHAKVVSASCPNLKVLLILFAESISADRIEAYLFDPHVLVQAYPAPPGTIYSVNRRTDRAEDWEAAHFGRPNMWTSAERVVVERKASAGRSLEAS